MKGVPCCENRSSGESLSDGLVSHGPGVHRAPPVLGSRAGWKSKGQDMARHGDVTDGLKKQLPNVVLKHFSLPGDWATKRVHFKMVAL